jgi:tetratricopeptide (TPR) repeat protein
MALQPAKRYPSGTLLAEDIEHWLADEPISAYPEPWLARARRQARRHRTLVASLVAALFVAALGAGAVVALKAAADRSEAAARQKEVEARISEAEGNERMALLERERGKKSAAISWLLRARDKLGQIDLDDGPQRQRRARMTYNLATLFRETEKVEKAENEYQQAVAEYEALVEESPENPESLSDLADAYHGHAHLRLVTGKRDEALAMYATAFDYQKRSIAQVPDNLRYRLSLALLHNDRALVHERVSAFTPMREDLEAALKVLEEARDKLAGEKNHDLDLDVRQALAGAHHNLGSCFAKQNDFKHATEQFQVSAQYADKLRREVPGVSDYDMAAAKAALNEGMCHLRVLDRELAEAPLTKSSEILKGLLARMPGDAEVQMAYASCQINLSQLTIQKVLSGAIPPADQPRVTAEIERQLQEADRMLQPLAKLPTEADRIMLVNGSIYFGFAALARQNQQWETEVHWSDRALALFRPLAERAPADKELSLKIFGARATRAEGLYRLERYAEALATADQLIATADQLIGTGIPLAGTSNLFRAGIQARSGAHAEGTAAAENVLAGLKGQATNENYFEVACIFSVAIEGLRRDKTLSEPQREEKARVYAARAVELIRLALKAGYPKIDKIRDSGKNGDLDLVPLRPREEFKLLLQDLQAAKK